MIYEIDSIGLIIIFFTSILLIYRTDPKSFKQSVNQFLLICNLTIFVSMLGALRIINYVESYLNLYTTLLDILLIVCSIIGFLIVAPSLAIKSYETFKDEYKLSYQLFWNEKVRISGYNNLKGNLKFELGDFKNNLALLKQEWKNEDGGKFPYKSLLLVASILMIIFSILYIFNKYRESYYDFINQLVGNLYGKWESLFKDESEAQLVLIISILTISLFYIIYKIYIAIKNKYLLSKIISYIIILIIINIMLLILCLQSFNEELENVALYASLIFMIVVLVLAKVQTWLMKNNK